MKLKETNRIIREAKERLRCMIVSYTIREDIINSFNIFCKEKKIKKSRLIQTLIEEFLRGVK